jgi:L-phenylalanine/L-methionine N-acetyltransferase
MLSFSIRSLRIEDATDINEMRRMDGVRENTLGLFSKRVSKSEEFIKDADEYMMARYNIK